MKLSHNSVAIIFPACLKLHHKPILDRPSCVLRFGIDLFPLTGWISSSVATSGVLYGIATITRRKI